MKTKYGQPRYLPRHYSYSGEQQTVMKPIAQQNWRVLIRILQLTGFKGFLNFPHLKILLDVV